MIGGPLMAVVRAQAQAAMTTVNFIKEVGFKKSDSLDFEESDTKDPVTVKFKYWKETQAFQPANPGNPTATPPIPATPEVPAKYEQQYLEVPILTIVPIPNLRIEETTIDFNAKITSIETQKTDTTVKVDASLEGDIGWIFNSAKFKSSFAFQQQNSTGVEVKKEFSLQIHVKAVQDQMPGGTEKILGILENSIASAPVRPAVTKP